MTSPSFTAPRTASNQPPPFNSSSSVSELEQLTYYELLGIDKDADQVTIKRAYFRLARQFHPDKNPNDPRAEARFKIIAEAYDVLTHAEKKSIYDALGKEGLKESASASEASAGMRDLVTVLFGAGKFADCFGELSFVLAFDPEFSAMDDEMKTAMLTSKSEVREKQLIEILRNKILVYIQQGKAEFVKRVSEDIKEKKEVPGGYSILSRLGYIYMQEAKQHLGRWLGFGSFLAEVREKGHVLKEAAKATIASAEMTRLIMEAEYEQNQQGKASTQTQKRVMEKGIDTIWKLGQLEMESIVRSVCSKVLKEERENRKKRGQALSLMGHMFRDAGKEGEGQGVRITI